jgi:hypothetical protein
MHNGKKSLWVKEFGAAVTVCRRDGTITEMNDKAVKTFETDGGLGLVGTNVLDCHPEPSKTQLKSMLENPAVNAYTIEKNGVKKLIYQAPYYEDSVYMGYVELSMEVPFDMKHFVRDVKNEN